MPVSATITSLYEFAPNTKARSSQVNQNFANLRGHNIPIDPNTATAATTSTYDLGVDDHRWRTVYSRDLDLATSTSTASLVLKGDSTNTTGAFLFQIEGVTKASVDTGGLVGTYLKTGSVPETALTQTALNFRVAVLTTGAGNWTIPAGVTSIYVECIGGGGGGGGGAGSIGGGGGGGAAAYMNSRYLTGLTPGATIAYSVGATGAGGAVASNGSAGGSTTFGGLVMSPGGAGGHGATSSSGNVGGSQTGAGIGSGGNGGTGGDANNAGGQTDGGTSYGGYYAGGVAQSAGGGNTSRGGGGGSSHFGQGGSGGASSAGIDASASSYGAGGQGGGGSNPGGNVGGDGAGGVIYIWY